MKITQTDAGSYSIEDNKGVILAILPFMFVFQHPRKKNVLVINGTGKRNDEKQSFMVNLDKTTVDINGVTATNFTTASVLLQKKYTNPIKDIYQEYAEITDYETMLSFMVKNNAKKQNVLDPEKKIQVTTYTLTEEDLTLTVTLNYNYKRDSPNDIDYIQMQRNHAVSSNISNGISIVGFDEVIKKYNYATVITYSYITLIEQSNLYQTEFESLTTYEDLLLFIKYHQSNVGGEKYNGNGQLTQKEYFCSFNTFSVRVTLTYYYMVGDPTKLSHISMSGTVSNIPLPIKVYNYDAEDNITHTYEASGWSRF